MKHGEWLPWLKANVPFDPTTAWRYAQCFEHRAKFCKLQNVSDAYSFMEATHCWRKQLPAPEVPAPSGNNGIQTDDIRRKIMLCGKFIP